MLLFTALKEPSSNNEMTKGAQKDVANIGLIELTDAAGYSTQGVL